MTYHLPANITADTTHLDHRFDAGTHRNLIASRQPAQTEALFTFSPTRTRPATTKKTSVPMAQPARAGMLSVEALAQQHILTQNPIIFDRFPNHKNWV